jgi:signal transduction histidine kinase
MISRGVLFGGLSMLTLVLGASALLIHSTTGPSNPFPRMPVQNMEFISDYTFLLILSQKFESVLLYWSKVLTTNKEVFFYGAITFFGIIMMSLAIGSAASGPKEKADSLLEVLKREKEHAENLARVKAEFLNQVSHELRTPLAVIIGYVECLTDGLYGQINPKHQEILMVVGKQSSHLRDMIDQILIFSRLEASKQPLRIQEFCINSVLNDLRETFDFLCKQKGLELKWELPADAIIVRTDVDRIKEVVSNLLQNALKYTDRGSIAIRLRQSRPNDIVLEVADTGIGIPDKFLTTIFDPFMQVHKTSTENSRGGIGLGLSIVKKHIEQIRGTITVESEVGKGSTFRIVLPRFYEQQESTRKQLLNLIKLPYSRMTTAALSKPTSVASGPGNAKDADSDRRLTA